MITLSCCLSPHILLKHTPKDDSNPIEIYTLFCENCKCERLIIKKVDQLKQSNFRYKQIQKERGITK